MTYQEVRQFWHAVLRDHGAIERAAKKGSYQDFMAIYKRVDRNIVYGGARSLLGDALVNPDFVARIQIAHKLLDDRADVNLQNALVRYMTTQDHDFVAEQPLLERIIQAGADINRPVGRWGTPLVALAAQFRFNESRLLPFYDVYFAQPHLDLNVVEGLPKHRLTTYEQIKKMQQLRPILVARAEARLTDTL